MTGLGFYLLTNLLIRLIDYNWTICVVYAIRKINERA